ncbi:unnamed protein product [Caenorhabditis sp. 36 PRJEB53466]|nr:unnamed protein product [Caenorhabditis sp. 36 PRJEB53466]
MFRAGEVSAGALVAWGFGFLLICLIACAVIYMVVVHFMKKGNGEDDVPYDLRNFDEEVTIICREREPEPSERQVSEKVENSSAKTKETKMVATTKIQAPQVKQQILDENLSQKTERSVKEVDKSERLEKPAPPNLSRENLSKESTEPELSSKKSLPDVSQKSEKIGGSTEPVKGIGGSVEYSAKAPSESEAAARLEKAPESSDTSGYHISSQRSELNHINMNEAGRTPPTDSKFENQMLGVTSSTEKVSLSLKAAAKRSSETSVSVTTPPTVIKK